MEPVSRGVRGPSNQPRSGIRTTEERPKAEYLRGNREVSYLPRSGLVQHFFVTDSSIKVMTCARFGFMVHKDSMKVAFIGSGYTGRVCAPNPTSETMATSLLGRVFPSGEPHFALAN